MSDHPLVDWLRDSEPGPLDDTSPGRRGRRVWAALAVLGGLWLGLLVAAWQVLGAPAPPPSSAPAAPEPPVPATPEPPAPIAPGPPAGQPADERLAAAHAVLAVRARGQGDASRYADLVVAEEVRWTDGAAIVTVLAHLLEGDGQHWSSARTARYGVALSVEGRVLTADAVWSLPAPELGAPRDWDAVTDSALAEAARGSLAAAGYRDIGDVDLAVHPDLPGVLRATAHATAPGEQQAGTHQVWLDRAAAGVLGWSG